MSEEVPCDVIAFLRRHRGWITAEPREGRYHVKVHWRPDLIDLDRTFASGGDALIYALTTAEKYGLVAVTAFRPGEGE